jgi:hypothetical protein
MNIEVYIGKSCQLKSFDILKEIHRLIQKNHLEDEVSLSASLCTADFSNPGVPVKIGEIFTDYVSKENLENVFGKYVLQTADQF